MGSSSFSYSTSSFSHFLYHHWCCNYSPQAFGGLLLLPLQCASNDSSPLEPPAEVLIIKSTPHTGSETGKGTSDHRQQQNHCRKARELKAADEQRAEQQRGELSLEMKVIKNPKPGPTLCHSLQTDQTHLYNGCINTGLPWPLKTQTEILCGPDKKINCERKCRAHYSVYAAIPNAQASTEGSIWDMKTKVKNPCPQAAYHLATGEAYI